MHVFDVAVPAPAGIDDHPCPSGRRSTISGKRLCLGHYRHAYVCCTPAKPEVHCKLICLLFLPSRVHEVHFELTRVVKRSYCIARSMNAVTTVTRRVMDRFGYLLGTNDTVGQSYT
jgi:hypothetical protein